MSKKRSSRKRGGVVRQDYRRGGRVRLQGGGPGTEFGPVDEQGNPIDVNVDEQGTPTTTTDPAKTTDTVGGTTKIPPGTGGVKPEDAVGFGDVEDPVTDPVTPPEGFTCEKGYKPELQQADRGPPKWVCVVDPSYVDPDDSDDDDGTDDGTTPQEGDTKTEDGINYTYTNGEWVKDTDDIEEEVDEDNIPDGATIVDNPITNEGGTPPDCKEGWAPKAQIIKINRADGGVSYERRSACHQVGERNISGQVDEALVDPEARKARIEGTAEYVAGTPIEEPQRENFPLDPEPQRGDYPQGTEGDIKFAMLHNQWKTKGDAEYQAALDAFEPGTTGGAIRGELPEDAKLGPAEQVGYQRDAAGNLLLDEDKNPIPLKEAATKKMTEDYGAGQREADKVTGAAAEQGTAERAVGREPGLNPQALIEQLIERGGPIMDTDMSSYKVDPETGNITKFTEDRGVVSWTPKEFAQEFGLATTASARTSKVIADLIRDDPSIDPAELEGLSKESIAKVTEIRELSGPAKAAQITKQAIEAAKAKDVEGALSAGAFIPEVGGIIQIMSPSPQAEEKTRAELTDEAAQKAAAIIPDGLLWESVSRSQVQGEDAKGVAREMLEETTGIPPEIVRTLVQPPASVAEQVDLLPVTVIPQVAALDPAILVSAQMQDLVGSLQTGQIPLWAKPAVDGVNQMMVARGLAASSIGRDGLFNAIITQAFPMAQSNAQALQARATQNLTHEQQAEVEESRLDMTRRMANLANRQTAASQTGQMAQQMQVLQSQFDMQTRMASEGQEQQVRMQNLANRQEAARVTAQNQQQINSQELGAASQIDLAELRAEEGRVGADQSFENQQRMSMYQTAADFMSKNAAFTQQMRQANMSEDNQMRMANLASRNQAASELLSNQERTELANLNSDVQIRLSYDKIASAMDLANLSVMQERAVKNAAKVANLDMTKFTLEQQVELANSKWMQTAEVTNMSARQQAAMQDATATAGLDLAAVDQRTKLSIRNAQAFLQMDMSNFTAEQQTVVLAAQQRQQSLLSNQSATNASRQFNATSENQMNQFMTNMSNNMAQFNTTQGNSMEQFNVQSKNMKNAQDAQREGDRQKFNAQLASNIDQFNEQITFQRDNWNTANAQAVEQSNTQWRRQANTINTAAQNKVNSQNAMNSFNMNQRSMSFLWQELRDQADFDFKGRENERQRKAALAMAALGNESAAYEGNTAWGERIAAALTAASSAFGETEDEPEGPG